MTNADEYAKIRAVNASVTVRVKDDAESPERDGREGGAGSGTRSRGEANRRGDARGV